MALSGVLVRRSPSVYFVAVLGRASRAPDPSLRVRPFVPPCSSSKPRLASNYFLASLQPATLLSCRATLLKRAISRCQNARPRRSVVGVVHRPRAARLGHRPARSARSPSRACGARGGSVRLGHRPARAARFPSRGTQAAAVAAVCGLGIGRPGLLALPQEHAAPVVAVCGFARRYVAQLLPVVLVCTGSPPDVGVTAGVGKRAGMYAPPGGSSVVVVEKLGVPEGGARARGIGN